MAKKAKSEEALVRQGGPDALMKAPDWVDSEDTFGKEGLRREDMKLPRLCIAQGLSDQIIPGTLAFIENLKLGEMFNDLTLENYGNGPYYMTIVRRDKPRGIEFIPRDMGGGVVDMNVPLDDPRMKWGVDGKQPQATLFYDYILILWPTKELVALSFKSTGIRIAKALNGLIGLRQGPLFSGVFSIASVMTKNAKGTFGVFDIRNAGWVSKEQGIHSKKVAHSIRETEFVIEREPGSDDEPFPGNAEAPPM